MFCFRSPIRPSYAYPSLHLSNNPSIYPTFVHPSVHSHISSLVYHPSVYMTFMHLLLPLPPPIFVYPSIDLFIQPSTYPSNRPPACPSPSVHLAWGIPNWCGVVSVRPKSGCAQFVEFPGAMLQKSLSFNVTQFRELLTGVSGMQLMPEARIKWLSTIEF